MIEQIQDGDITIAYIIRNDDIRDISETVFITDDKDYLQVGFSAHKTNGEIIPHMHKPIDRTINGTAEVVFIKNGSCIADLYNDKKEFICSENLFAGDVIVLLKGGHGFRMEEDTILFEVKQGPYLGNDDKERF